MLDDDDLAEMGLGDSDMKGNIYYQYQYQYQSTTSLS
jgi:hypothetical protein